MKPRDKEGKFVEVPNPVDKEILAIMKIHHILQEFQDSGLAIRRILGYTLRRELYLTIADTEVKFP